MTGEPRTATERARAALKPLAPGERPWPAVAAALLAYALGAFTLVLYLAGVTVSGSRPSSSVVIVYTGLMLGVGTNLLLLRYWAVLAFQALLAIGILGFALAAIRATSVPWLLVCVAVIGAAGALFWKLVRVAGRIDVTERRGGADNADASAEPSDRLDDDD